MHAIMGKGQKTWGRAPVYDCDLASCESWEVCDCHLV